MLFNKRHFTDRNEAIIVEPNKFNEAIEEYNRLKDNILFLNADGRVQVIQIESSVFHEGKTTVVCNLAVSLGLTEKKVIVVDLDFRKPRVQQCFGLPTDIGITDYMKGDKSFEEIIKHTSYHNVDIITRGEKTYNPSIVFVADKFKKFMAELRKNYDFVLLDCAPILQVSDYINISQYSDGVLFLCAYASTTRTQVAEAVAALKKNNCKILGSVFTMYSHKAEGYYDYYKSYYSRDEGIALSQLTLDPNTIAKIDEDEESTNEEKKDSEQK